MSRRISDIDRRVMRILPLMTQSRLSLRLKANHGGLLGATNQQRHVAGVTGSACSGGATSIPLVTSKRVGLFSPRRGQWLLDWGMSFIGSDASWLCCFSHCRSSH